MDKINLFELFNKKYSNRCPVSYDSRIWLEKSFSLLFDIFDKEKIKQKKILIPHHSSFPIKYNGNTQTAFDTLKIVAEQMEVEIDEIQLNVYDEGINSISIGSLRGGRIFFNSRDKNKGSAGLYWGKQADNKYYIGLERKKLTQPELMVATLGHELAHIKLLGEDRIKVNDEKLTDLTTIIFGLGIFNANVAFQTIRTIDSSGWRKIGYLTQMEWCYALSLHAFIRDEKAPNWIESLTLNVKEGFKQGARFIENNKNLIFA
jgi:hypothetical protein